MALGPLGPLDKSVRQREWFFGKLTDPGLSFLFPSPLGEDGKGIRETRNLSAPWPALGFFLLLSSPGCLLCLTLKAKDNIESVNQRRQKKIVKT